VHSRDRRNCCYRSVVGSTETVLSLSAEDRWDAKPLVHKVVTLVDEAGEYAVADGEVGRFEEMLGRRY
jgi:hypothetical protein